MIDPDLVEVLRWEPSSVSDETQSILDVAHIEKAQRFFTLFLDRVAVLDSGRADALQALVVKFSPSRWIEFISAPTVNASLRFIHDRLESKELIINAAEAFDEWLRIEILPGELLSKTEGPLWNVDGSKCFRPNFLSPNTFRDDELKVDVYIAPKIQDRTITDFYHTGIWKHADVGITTWVNHSIAETIEIGNSLDQTLKFMSEVPAARDFMCRHTVALHFRRTPEVPSLGSSTNILRIGSSFIRNYSHSEHGKVELTELALHESIHNYLAKFETCFEFFTKHIAPSRSATESPWTGNTIPIMAFSQACYVWFGLWSFYLRLDSQSPQSNFSSRRLQCAAGFLRNGSLSDTIIGGSELFSQKFLIDLNRMTLIVRDYEIPRFDSLTEFRKAIAG